MIHLANVIQELLSDNVIVQSYIYSTKSPKYWRLVKDVEVQLSNGDVIIIPAGYCAEVDAEYLRWMMITNTNYFDNYVRYLVVRAFGWLYWKKWI